jgi:hypothetical protein
MRDKIQRAVEQRIGELPDGAVFSAKDMAELGSRAALDQALSRLAASGRIRRVLRGLYDKPVFSSFLGQELSPNIEQAAIALARKHGWTVQPSGSVTLNELGISTQVPGRYVFLSSGPSRTIVIGRTEIRFRHVAQKEMELQHPASARFIHAIRALGKDRVDDAVAAKLQRLIPVGDGPQILRETKYAPAWVYAVIKRVVEAA